MVEFYEKAYPKNLIPVERVACDLHGINAQLKTLRDVKLELARQAKALGCVAVIDFKYGQRDHAWWQFWGSLFNDNMSWYGEGMACKNKSGKD
ncbi:MAG: hypothetical protein FWC61_03825 [Proteobacteria bacterium]|nr:hypothetical protein [Pseudomonadota bacterium]